MWRLNVGLLWSSLVWCCSTFHGVSQPAPVAPSKPQPGREAACPGPACRGTFPASFAGAILSLPCQPMPPAHAVSSVSCKHQRWCQTEGAIPRGGPERCVVHPRGGSEVGTQGQPSWWTSQQAAAPSWLSCIPRMTRSHLVSTRAATSALPLGSNGKGSSLCNTLQQLLRRVFLSVGERIGILLCFFSKAKRSQRKHFRSNSLTKLWVHVVTKSHVFWTFIKPSVINHMCNFSLGSLEAGGDALQPRTMCCCKEGERQPCGEGSRAKLSPSACLRKFGAALLAEVSGAAPALRHCNWDHTLA